MTTSGSRSSSQFSRGMTDITLAHVIEGVDPNGRKTLKCLHGGKVTRGGRIFRMKQHLDRTKGDVCACLKVPFDLQYLIRESLKDIGIKNKEKADSSKYNTPYGAPVHGFEGDMLNEDSEEFRPSEIHINEGRFGSKKQSTMLDKSKRKKSIGFGDYFAPRTIGGSQPSIRSCLAGKDATWRADMAFARFFYDACIPINVVNSIYLQSLVDAIVALGPRYKHSNYHGLRVNLLRDAKKEVQLLVDSYRKIWENVGCTLMTDGWTNNSHRSLINFMVYCPKGVRFVKSIDASDVVKDVGTLLKMFEEVALWVGPNSIVHFVSNNGSNYKAARRMLSKKYLSITWSPCVAHSINLVLKDIVEMDHIVYLARRASEVTKFIYNHTFLIAWLRKRQGWKEIVCPGATRFATTFIAMRSIHEHKPW
ncbi:uncharacterized protein LOC116113089 [Pistacia vera]|uniref:uncharacterized protein LOC116113089 n=1 Tax=Pistacia vera TaxID=55513 RepID=UPI0012632617|nr:uncharacterized protein LOC116113089 [Pistacia vera]